MSMSDGEADPQLNHDVDADNYATTAAHDTPTDQSSRTAQSDADFEAQRLSYTAKIDTGDVSSHAFYVSYMSMQSCLDSGVHHSFPYAGMRKRSLRKLPTARG